MFFNYSTHIADNRWSRRTFVRSWWKIYSDDPRWTPPDHRLFTRTVQQGQFDYIDKASPIRLHLDALRRPRQQMTTSPGSNSGLSGGISGAIFEEPVAATTLLIDPRHTDRTAYLAGFRFTNDSEVLDHTLAIFMEELWKRGCRRIVGPVDYSPHLSAGVLHDHFHVTPPMGTPYNPPYVPELMDRAMRPLNRSRLYQQTLPKASPTTVHAPAVLSRIQPRRLIGDLFPIFQAGFVERDNLPIPDLPEATFLLAWAMAWPVEVWLATVNQEPVGFIMVQPDLSNRIRRANGGRNPLWRAWLAWAQERPSTAGNVLYFGVVEHWRRKGIGRQLWQHVQTVGHENGWRQLNAGPIVDGSDAATFLTQMGAEQRQHYTTYFLDI